MTERERARGPWIVWGVIIVGLGVTVALGVRNGSLSKDPIFISIAIVMMVGYATVGAVVASRVRNALGWLMITVGAMFLVSSLAEEAATFTFRTSPGFLPDVVKDAALIANNAGFFFALWPIPLLIALFPTGRVPSRRWRWYPAALTIVFALAFLATLLHPGPIDVDTGIQPPNPIGVPSLKGALDGVQAIGGFLMFGLALLSVVIVIVRFRSSQGEVRQQLRWLAAVAASAVVALIVGILSALPLGPNGSSFLNDAAFLVLLLLIGLGVPGAIGIALLRYRLWDLDIVVRKTVVGAIVVVLVTAVSLLALVVAGSAVVGPILGVSDSLENGLIAGIAVGLSFWPLRRLARRISDRVVYGGRATPYDVLTEFSGRMSDAYATEDVLPRMASIVAAGTRAERAGIWLLVGREMRPAATWPPEAPGAEAVSASTLAELDTGSFEVRHQGELLGAITVSMPAADPMNPSKEKLIRDLASQAGLVLRNVRLIEELRASRRRIVTTQDERAKTLERNIHDGAQQQLVALAVRLRLAEGLARKDPERTAAMLAELQAEASEALENLRDLARGIYPPMLADRGLAEALAAQARKSAVPVDVDAHGVGRYLPEVESAVYFCSLEALQNAAKYANASRTAIRLRQANGALSFEVVDDGAGFDPDETGYGTGLRGMADRLEALGGHLEVRSTPGAGTRVTGTVPVQREAVAAAQADSRRSGPNTALGM